MFVGFIAVVVILLVVVGLMSTGATNGSGGVDQTKATKVISEIGALAQSTGFAKTVSATSNYSELAETAVGDGLGVDFLVSAGIIDTADIVATDAGLSTVNGLTVHGEDGATVPAADSNLIVSKAIQGLFYQIRGNGVNNFDVVVYADDALPALQKQALFSNYGKFATSATVVATADILPLTPEKDVQGAATITFK